MWGRNFTRKISGPAPMAFPGRAHWALRQHRQSVENSRSASAFAFAFGSLRNKFSRRGELDVNLRPGEAQSRSLARSSLRSLDRSARISPPPSSDRGPLRRLAFRFSAPREVGGRSSPALRFRVPGYLHLPSFIITFKPLYCSSVLPSKQ